MASASSASSPTPWFQIMRRSSPWESRGRHRSSRLPLPRCSALVCSFLATEMLAAAGLAAPPLLVLLALEVRRRLAAREGDLEVRRRAAAWVREKERRSKGAGSSRWPRTRVGPPPPPLAAPNSISVLIVRSIASSSAETGAHRRSPLAQHLLHPHLYVKPIYASGPRLQVTDELHLFPITSLSSPCPFSSLKFCCARLVGQENGPVLGLGRWRPTSTADFGGCDRPATAGFRTSSSPSLCDVLLLDGFIHPDVISFGKGV